MNMFSDKFYKKNILNFNYVSPSDTNNNEISNLINIKRQADLNEIEFYYITDLHLDYKIKRKFNKSGSFKKVNNYIKKIVNDMCTSIKCKYESFLLIGGDVSHSFEINKIFYTELVNFLEENKIHTKIIAILGNHELLEENSVEKSIKKYKELFQSLNISFLNNSLFIATTFGAHFPIRSFEIINDLNQLSDKEIFNKISNSAIIIYGGIGFAPFNEKYNYSYGLYGSSISSKEQEQEYSRQFMFGYEKLEKCFSTNEVVIFSHMPTEDWLDKKCNSRWIYINGHTHFNKLVINAERTNYSDNQIGYYGEKYYLKMFYKTKKVNIFNNFSDGIHEISDEKYIEFYHKLGVPMTYNKKDEKVLLIKNRETFMFILKKSNGTIMLLDGGKPLNLKNQNVYYYYYKIGKYHEKINELFEPWKDTISKLSEVIKKIGGSGKIHGCIIDIDPFSHVFLNPYDKKITFYYASSTTEIYVYEDLRTLLLYNNLALFNNYNEIVNNHNQSLVVKEFQGKVIMTNSTEHYKISFLIKKFQYMFDDNIIRKWDEDIFETNILSINTQDVKSIEK